MADKTTTSLTAGTIPLAGSELVYGVQGGNSRKFTASQVAQSPHTQGWGTITGTPTTLSGYGITDAQPLDADLTAIAALTTTGFGRGFLPLADEAAFKAYVNLEIGVDVQAQGATLSSLEGLPLVSGDILYATGADTLARLPKGTDGQILNLTAGLPTWSSVAGTGDMVKAVYDPTNINASAFARANHTGTQAISTITGLQTSLDSKLVAADIANMLETSDIGVSVQAHSANLDELALVNPDTAGKAILAADTSATVRDYLDTPVYVTNRAALKLIDPAKDSVAEVYAEGGCNGVFDRIVISAQTADIQAEITADTLEGLYVKSTVDPLIAWMRRSSSIDPEYFGTNGAAYDAAIAMAALRGVARGTGPEPVYIMNGARAPSGGFSVDDSLIYIAPGSTLYGNTTHGWIQRITTLPPNFNDFSLDTVNAVRYFDAQVKDTTNPLLTNGLLKAGAPAHFALVFGMNSPAIGTPLSIRASTEVYDVGTPDVGYNEIGGIYNHIIVHGDRVQPASKYSIWAHDTIAMSGKNRPKWMGASFRFHYMSSANSNGGFGTGEGLSGISVMQRPLYADDATYSGYLTTDPVYPMAAGITISGYGGPQSATDGTHANALHAFYNGLQIGGANSPYLAESARSKLLNAISIQDYTLQGIVITNPHPSFNPAAGSGAAIAIGSSAGIVNIGLASPSGVAALHVRYASNGNIKLYQQESQSTSKQTSINFNGIASLGTDLGAGNVNVFGLYHSTAGKYGFTVNADGHFALSNPPTSAAGLAAGTLWKDNAAGGVVKVA